jgi:bisphosphoglycerate-dependent phosphoglycerate mutase
MYLPANGISNIDNKGYLSTPTPQAIADAVAVLIVAQGSAIKAVVISVVGNSAEQITKVTVDNKFDVQRRRANKQLATTVGTATV